MNPRPADYESAALPLSYLGLLVEKSFYHKLLSCPQLRPSVALADETLMDEALAGEALVDETLTDETLVNEAPADEARRRNADERAAL